MSRLVEKDISNFVRIWVILVPTMLGLSLAMVFCSWPDRWLAWSVCILAVLFGFFALRHTSMARRALAVVRRGQPETCTVEIRKESGDGRDYVRGKVCRDANNQWDVLFSGPLWDVDPVLLRPLQAKAYFEPASGAPLVVLIDGRHLWAETAPAKWVPVANRG